MKGFIFSIEALFSISILIVALVILGTPIIGENENNEYLIIQSQGSATNSFYFNEIPTSGELTTQYCVKIIYYENNELKDKTFCEGIE